MDQLQRLTIANDILIREATYLDEQRWPEWLDLFHPECEYWVPSRRDDGALIEDPKREVSLVYYSSRGGLEDRVTRITSGKAPASAPMPRTVHLIGNVHLAEDQGSSDRIGAKSAWVVHLYDTKHCKSYEFFGRSEHTLVHSQGGWRIMRKRVVLMNDRLPTALDIYCL